MAGVSSLLKSAEATQKKVRDLQDAEVAFEWSQSAKTYDDFAAYSSYLAGQANNAQDPNSQLNYQKTISSARSAYVSNEIQRQSIDVLEGRSTNTQKYGQMVNLYYQAVDNGNLDLAQSMVLQLDNLSVKIQNEAEAAQNAAATMAMNGVKSLGQLVDKMKNGNDYIELADGTVVKPMAMLGDELSANGRTSADYFGELYRTVSAMTNVIGNAYQGATTQDAVDAIESRFGDVLRGTENFKTSAGSLNVQDIELAYRSALANNPLYSVVTGRDATTGKTQYSLQKNKVDDFAWIRNDDGTYQAVNVMTKQPDKYQSLDTQITDNGYIIGNELKAGEQGYQNGKKIGQIAGGTGTIERNDSLSIKNRLANLGYTATQNTDGTLTILDPSGRQFTGTIMPDGTVRYFGDPGQYSGGQAGLYQVNIFNGSVNEVNPADVSIFGEQSQFGGLLSQASDEGKRIISSLAGVSKPLTDLLPPTASITNLKSDFSGNNVPILGSGLQGTTNVLASSQAAQDAKMRALELQAKQEMANTLQPATAFNLNQTPVGTGVNRSIPLAKPAALPSISVAPAAPTQTISGVTQAPAQPKLNVAKPQAQPTLKVL